MSRYGRRGGRASQWKVGSWAAAAKGVGEICNNLLLSNNGGLPARPTGVGQGAADAGWRVKNCSLLMPAGTATSKKPTIISFQVCSPQTTVALGSGLCGLLAELSYQAMACSLVPAFINRGSTSL